MLQDPVTIRHYQRLTDNLSELIYQGYGYEETRLYAKGYCSALRYGSDLEPYQISRLEDEANSYLRDPSSALPQLMPMKELEY